MSIPTFLRKSIFLLFITLSVFSRSLAQDKKKAIDLLRKNLKASELNQAMLDSYVVTDAYEEKKTGQFLVYLQQTYLGIPVYNKIGVYIFKNDSLVEKRTDFIGKIAAKAGVKTIYAVDPSQAIHHAARNLSIPLLREPRLIQRDAVHQRFVYSPAGELRQNMSSSLVWLPLNDGKEVRLSWNVRIGSDKGKEDWLVRVDAQTGEVLEKSTLIVHEQEPGKQVKSLAVGPPAVSSAGYRVYAFPMESGNFGSRVVDTDPWLKPGAGNNATTLGWHFDNSTNYSFTRGNNVWAQEDLDGDTSTVGVADTSSTGSPSLTFDRTLDNTLNPSTYSNLRAGLDNLFYWNNIMHDISYQYGFDEAAGNFQTDNLGRGGQGSDHVHAFALDGSGLNNAFFGTPPDGESPTMWMYQWNTSVVPHLHINTPAPFNIDYTAAQSDINFKSQLGVKGPITADIVLLQDSPPGTSRACGLTSNASSLVNKIALLDRGSCNFAVKIKNAQTAGAIAVIVVNNIAGVPTNMTGTDTSIVIPAIMISKTAGDTLKANLTGLNGTLSTTGVFLDGALDNGVISHEYTHGISNRLTGGPSNTDCLANAEQMGEGWSDYMALMVTTNWSSAVAGDSSKKRPIGTYVLGQPATGSGIRTFPYSTDMSVDPWTYDLLATATAGEVHTIGEIWCSTLWDMTWNIIRMEGIDTDIYHGTKGNNIALQLVIQAMKYQPCSPGFIDGRDAILKADSLLYNYAHKCAIWNAFAKRGMGKSANQGSSSSYTDQIAAFDLPMSLGISQTVNKPLLTHGDNITYTVKAYCDCSPLSNISIVDTLSGDLSYVSSPGGTYTAPYVHFDGVNFAANETKTFTIQASVSGNYALKDTLINDGRDPAAYNWTMNVATGGTLFSESTTRAHSGSHAWYASDQATNTDFMLTSGALALDTISTLSFWHYYDTDPGYDGGVVEISTDGGSSWKDLGPYMTQNPYNSNLNQFTSGLADRKAFSGSSGGGFIQTVVVLTGFAGTNAKIRFRFASDNSSGGDGWYIDDVVLKNESGVVSVTNAFSGATLLSKQNTVSLFASVPLPVNFMEFVANKVDETVVLHWKVNGEINVNKYIVERSGDGGTYTAIGELPASSSSGNVKNYAFTDAQPLKGKNYYRIVEKDLDGKASYSDTRLIQFSSTDLLIQLSPVPTYNHMVQLELSTGSDIPAAGVLVNILGQTVKGYLLKQGTNALNLEDLPKGVYFLKIQVDSNNTVVRKLVIQ